jgi:pheromone shutdown protein TraB
MKTYKNNSTGNQGNANPDRNLDSLINELKEKDEKTRKTLRNFSILMTILVFFYFGLMVINPDKELTINQRISGICYVTAFIAGAVIFRNEYFKLSAKNYSRPLLTMLKEQTEKFRFFSNRFFKLLIVPVFINIGLSIAPPRYIPTDWPQMKRILFLQVVFLTILIIAGLIGYFVTRKKNQPFLDSINAIIKDLEK